LNWGNGSWDSFRGKKSKAIIEMTMESDDGLLEGILLGIWGPDGMRFVQMKSRVFVYSCLDVVF